MANGYDLAVVGAGIVGIGVALAAVRQGKKVVVIERNAKAVGASIRNFGFVTISGQKGGAHWERAMRARDIWSEIVDEAGIAVIHRGLVTPARRSEAAVIVDAFLKTPMGEKCRLMTKAEAGDLVPSLRLDGVEAILYSPHELRVESSEALPKLAVWLEARHKVDFRWNTAVRAIEGTRIETSHGAIEAQAVVVCPGDDFSTLFPDVIAKHNLTICTLQMLRVAPAQPSRFGAAVMSDMSLARYEGFAHLPEAEALGKRLDLEEAESRAAGIHLIAVQSTDGSLVVGDSHVYGNAQQPFASERFDRLILEEFDRVFDLPGRTVVNRWIGTYASSKERTVLVERPADHIRLVMVTGGTGASTGFALGEQVIDDLYASISRSWE
ncbi:TIGR03364 family FAD-dependent oxidoreductase [Rhizobium sp. CNPSo 4039]|uniref:TIGR03364 family FAD-dependent oxidoreductase n=1 Tax=Rhizobium sp. CNPSo 4039 TaxID=3021409 RepID=UPI00254B975E|nr:TIGR03364 family FAD-dependent oxidoreductase [Rhizobium sp. CNPSo 4039]MDK4715510.1 TIGR03364 family FAD-dependent oxidoreductase [Rhizobium sp. CNPSo 4039]